MRPVVLLAASLLLGTAVGGLMYVVTKEEPQPLAPPVRPSTPAPLPAPPPTLETDPSRPQGLAAVEARLLEKPRTRQLAALALLYAAEGRDQDLLRMLHAAIEAGVDSDRVLDAIRELPAARQGVALAQILDRHPDVDFDGYDVARIFEDAGDPQRALTVVHEALPAQGEFDADLTQLLLRLDPKQGPAFLFSLDGGATWPAEDLQALYGFLVESGNEANAPAFLERALEANPRDHDMLRVLARIAPAEAIDRLRAIVADDPADIEAWSRLGRLLRKQGDTGGAFAALEKAARLDPSRTMFESLLRVDPQRALPLVIAWTEGAKDDEAIGLLARAYMKAGRTREAIDVFERARESDPNDSEWIKGLIRLDPQRAASSLAAQIQAAPAAADAELLGQYADALRAAGKSAESFDQYVAAHRKDPGDSDWQESMARVDPERALPVLERFLQEDPGDASGRGAYGIALAAGGRVSEAASQFERALSRGNAKKWYAELAKIDPDRALNRLTRRAERDDDDEMWGTLGRVLTDLGRGA